MLSSYLAWESVGLLAQTIRGGRTLAPARCKGQCSGMTDTQEVGTSVVMESDTKERNSSDFQQGTRWLSILENLGCGR